MRTLLPFGYSKRDPFYTPGTVAGSGWDRGKDGTWTRSSLGLNPEEQWDPIAFATTQSCSPELGVRRRDTGGLGGQSHTASSREPLPENLSAGLLGEPLTAARGHGELTFVDLRIRRPDPPLPEKHP